MQTRVRQSDAAPDANSRAGRDDAGVERLVHEVGEVVENAPEGERAELRDYAIELFREESDTARQKATERIAEARRSPLGVFGFVLLLIVAGGALLLILPPVGIVFLLLALVLAAGALLYAIFGKVRGALSHSMPSRTEPAGPSGTRATDRSSPDDG